MFGSWPTEQFRELPPEAQEAFWKEAAGANGSAQLQEHLIKTLTRRRVEQEASSLDGTYLPLSVYAK
eukprot:4271914-Alexandrium_andersonii.AAC.1